MIASELKDATRAAAKAEAAADQTNQLTTQVRADADKYRETVAQLSDTATQVDVRFKALEGRISAEGAHAVASSQLQLTQLAGRVEELSGVVKTLASESRDSRGLMQNYDERIKDIDQKAATKKAEFSENSQYFVEVVYHPKNEASTEFARNLEKELLNRGYRASTGVWGDTVSSGFDSIGIRSKDGVSKEFVDQLRRLTRDLAILYLGNMPIQIKTGLSDTFTADVAVFLQAES
jgi:hypothetical protein